MGLTVYIMNNSLSTKSLTKKLKHVSYVKPVKFNPFDLSKSRYAYSTHHIMHLKNLEGNSLIRALQ
jgi:hypothetical protein